MLASSFLSVFVVGSLIGLSTQTCHKDEDCSLNGLCQSHKLRTSGYNHTHESVSSWCGSIVRDPKDPKLHHMFFSLFANHCPLKSWMPFSTIAHATSRTGPAGPYESPVQVVGTFAHNPTVIWSPADKEYLMYHIGCPQPAPDVCGPTKFTCGAPDGQSGITVRSSRDLATWTNRGIVFNGTYDKTVWDRTATNPSAWPLYSSKNKTHAMLLAYRGNSLNATNFSSGNIAVSSNGFEGPYTRIQKNSLMPVRFEDPFLWQDKRGNYHMLVHAQQDGNGGTPGVKQTGRHAYARNYHGPWTYGNRTLAYGALVNFTDGTSINYGRRERPQLLFSDDGNMVPLFMTNGVQEKGTNMSYTIVSPIGDAGVRLQ